MAIIRNERSARTRSDTVEDVEPVEEEIDYTWHPNEDEYVSPLSAEQWADLLREESFSQSDAGRAVRCLRDYGEPATFQQLSIRYRGTMGRYRRWLAEAAQTAGTRFGVDVPQKDQFGMDEWWPLLYQTRNAGKPGAGIFEMQLRPEVEDAFLLLEEEERQAKRAENARQLKRIEQLERARQEERRRAADARNGSNGREVSSATAPDDATAATQPGERARAHDAVSASQNPQAQAMGSHAQVQGAYPQNQSQLSDASAQAGDGRVVSGGGQSVAGGSQSASKLSADGAVSVPMSRLKSADSQAQGAPTTPGTAAAAPTPVAGLVQDGAGAAADEPAEDLPLTRAFLELMQEMPSHAARFVASGASGSQISGTASGTANTSDGSAPTQTGATKAAAVTDVAAPVDYALRYAERLRHAITLMRTASPSITLAAIARELGDESVARLQATINGQEIPTFAYVDVLRVRAFVNPARLEAPDGLEEGLPVFEALQEVAGIEGAVAALVRDVPREVSYVVDDSDDRRTGVIVRFSDVRCSLLTRDAVRGAAHRGDNAQLEAFIRMVDELDSFARSHGVERTSRQITAADWDALAAGTVWPGSLLH